jgi:hypothetical protein
VTEEAVREYLSQLGKKGAAATNQKLTAAQRSKSAIRAAKARWAQHEKTGKAVKEKLDGAEALLKVAKRGARRAKKKKGT